MTDQRAELTLIGDVVLMVASTFPARLPGRGSEWYRWLFGQTLSRGGDS